MPQSLPARGASPWHRNDIGRLQESENKEARTQIFTQNCQMWWDSQIASAPGKAFEMTAPVRARFKFSGTTLRHSYATFRYLAWITTPARDRDSLDTFLERLAADINTSQEQLRQTYINWPVQSCGGAPEFANLRPGTASTEAVNELFEKLHGRYAPAVSEAGATADSSEQRSKTGSTQYDSDSSGYSDAAGDEGEDDEDEDSDDEEFQERSSAQPALSSASSSSSRATRGSRRRTTHQ